MKTKMYDELQTMDEFVKYFTGAGRRELKHRLKNIPENTRDRIKQNERSAIKLLLS